LNNKALIAHSAPIEIAQKNLATGAAK